MTSLETATLGAADLLTLVRKSVNVGKVHTQARKPFRFFLCGDPSLVAALRALLLYAPEDACVPLDAASTLETIDPERRETILGSDARCIIFLGRPGDLAGARIDLLRPFKLPIFALTLDPVACETATQPLAAPLAGAVAEYTIPRIDREALRGRVFPHVIDRCKGIEVAVGRRLPALRETVAAKVTRDAASSALKIAAASAVVDHVPLLGIVLGAVATAGDLVAITGIQIVLMMQIGATYGKDPDMARIWELLPIVGGGLGWRALSREISGFIPVAGIAIKGAIAYAGTIVVGEGVGFFYEHGRHMTSAQATALYDEKKRTALSFARDFVTRMRRGG
ncbi:MAG: hypothetical protein NVSMB21_21470 [Vulcanimicrobiaceae bacterium]